MLILAIDTSSRTGSIALLRDNLVLSEISGHEETLYSTRLFRDLELLQSQAQFRMDQIDLFAVVAGPGSFTGLRVGLAAVKGWSEVHGKPIAAVSALEAVAAQAVMPKSDVEGSLGVIAPFLDARRGQLFGSVYLCQPEHSSATLKLIADETVFSAVEFLALVQGSEYRGNSIFVSSTPDLLPESLIAQTFPNASIQTASPILAPVVGRLGFKRAQRGELVDALSLDANYVRRSDAEAAWKDSR